MGAQYRAFKHYEPSEAAAIIFAVVFGILLAAHILQSVRAKIYYLWPLILATTLECAGYILREYTIHHRMEKAPSVIGQVFIIIAPACLAAAMYMIVERIILQVGKVYCSLRPSWITPIFVGFDVVSIGLQSIGATLLFNNEDDLTELKKARKILIAGLLVQLVAFTVFLVLAWLFDRKAVKGSPSKMVIVRPLMTAFYVTGALVMIRSIYRAIEFITVNFNVIPPTGYFFYVEWAYYVLDALPIALATAVYNLAFPSKYLREQNLESNPKYEQVPLSSTDEGNAKADNQV
ncbi:hypothetical protein FRC17_009810 [Serendipita sp. 399]|nr:hypothetical protein FRC17_009810 [Serendipita sp. 399]